MDRIIATFGIHLVVILRRLLMERCRLFETWKMLNLPFIRLTFKKRILLVILLNLMQTVRELSVSLWNGLILEQVLINDNIHIVYMEQWTGPYF